jgi:hypothetical protein
VHRCAITSVAPGTDRATRRTAAINWVTVSWVATASSRIVESIARRVFPVNTPVSAITTRTAAKIRFGRGEERRSRPCAPNLAFYEPKRAGQRGSIRRLRSECEGPAGWVSLVTAVVPPIGRELSRRCLLAVARAWGDHRRRERPAGVPCAEGCSSGSWGWVAAVGYAGVTWSNSTGR